MSFTDNIPKAGSQYTRTLAHGEPSNAHRIELALARAYAINKQFHESIKYYKISGIDQHLTSVIYLFYFQRSHRKLSINWISMMYNIAIFPIQNRLQCVLADGRVLIGHYNIFRITRSHLEM